MNWKDAPDVKKIIKRLVTGLHLAHVKPSHLICFRSQGSTSRARARIWSLPTVWQQALHIEPHYVIEVLSEHFDHLSIDDQTRVLIHELMHIPRTFSGALVPHRGRHHRIDTRSVEKLFKQYAAHISR